MRIEVSDLSKEYKGVKVLQNVSMQFESGHIYGIVGKNGSGKTMLLRAIAGLIVPTGGSVLVDGKKVGKDISFPQEMGILIEKPEFLNHLTGLDNLKILAEIRKKVSVEQIKSYMEWFELENDPKKPVRKYSQGMKQKLGIIQALMEEPELLILDESFNALDEASVVKLRELLLKYKEEGRLIIITSHNREDIESLCDDTYFIQDGKIISPTGNYRGQV